MSPLRRTVLALGAALAAALALPAAGEAKLVIIGNAAEVKQMKERLRRLCLDREIDVFQDPPGVGHWVVAVGDPPPGGDRRTPLGCRIVAELAWNEKHTALIRHDPQLNVPKVSADDRQGSTNGQGSSSAIGWNPTDTDTTYTVRSAYGDEIPEPLDVLLAHELIHAWRMMTGTRACGADGQPDKAADEEQTIEAGPLTENHIRLEQDRATGKELPPRTGHWIRINRRKPKRVSTRPARPKPSRPPARRPGAAIPA